MQLNTVQTQNDKLLNDILYRNYYIELKNKDSKKQIDLLFYNKNNFNNVCEGCSYFVNNEVKYKEDDFQYINDININLKNILGWYSINEFQCDINLKGTTKDNVNDILTIIIDYFMDKNFKPKNIYIYTSKFYDIEEWRDIYKSNGITLIIKFCINGLYCDQEEVLESEYKDIINSIKNNDDIVIACVTSKNISNWIQNYKWWINQLKEQALTNIILTESKDDSWDYESTGYYINFLDFQIDTLLELISPENLTQLITTKNPTIVFQTIQVQDQGIIDNSQYYARCPFHTNLIINMHNLALLLCPKIDSPDFYIGFYDNENKQWQAKNVELTILKAHLKRSSTPHCEKCKIIGICDGFCYGESYNKILNPLIPVRHGCLFSISKYNFLLYKYSMLDILKFDNKNKAFNKYIKNLTATIQSALKE